jgi:hypothetical protein
MYQTAQSRINKGFDIADANSKYGPTKGIKTKTYIPYNKKLTDVVKNVIYKSSTEEPSDTDRWNTDMKGIEQPPPTIYHKMMGEKNDKKSKEVDYLDDSIEQLLKYSGFIMIIIAIIYYFMNKG